jgi:hypothetical protein
VPEPHTSTLTDLVDAPRGPVGRGARYAGIGLLVLVVAAAAGGLLGPRERTTMTTEGDHTLTLTYPSVTRAGQPAPLHLRIERPGGFSGPIQVSFSDDFFNHLDFQNWYPAPAGEVGEGDRVLYEFDPPPGEVFEVSLDARTSPGQFGGFDRYEVGLLVGDATIARTSFTVWTMP